MTDEEQFLAGHFLMQYNATIMNYCCTAQLQT